MQSDELLADLAAIMDRASVPVIGPRIAEDANHDVARGEYQTFRPEDSEGLVKGLFGCIDGRDWAGLSEFLHDEAIYERPGYEPFVGKPAILDFYLTKRIISLGQHASRRC